MGKIITDRNEGSVVLGNICVLIPKCVEFTKYFARIQKYTILTIYFLSCLLSYLRIYNILRELNYFDIIFTLCHIIARHI